MPWRAHLALLTAASPDLHLNRARSRRLGGISQGFHTFPNVNMVSVSA
jgi:hypothetical protein